MSEHKWEHMNEEEFDIMLERSLSDVPPESVVVGVTPWKKAVNRVIIGFLLSTVFLNFWHLNYILPTAGTVLVLLGFRALRNDNAWFRACFTASVAETVVFFQGKIFDAVLLETHNAISHLKYVLAFIAALVLIFEMFCFWRGLISVKRSVNLPPRATGALILLICYVAVCVLTIINIDSPIINIPLIILYFISVLSVYKTSKELDKVGYVVEPAMIKISDRWIVSSITLLLAVGLALCYAFGGGYDMKWEKANVSLSPGSQAASEHLTELGFPKYVLSDLTQSDIDSLATASKVVAEVEENMVVAGKFASKNMRITTVAVQLSEEKWTVIHHFMWLNDIGFCGTHSLQIWPTYQELNSGWSADGEVTGRLLYDMNGETFAAPYYYLGNRTFNSGDFVFARGTVTDTFAAFSLPKSGENCRGYILYSTTKADDTDFFTSWLNYTYQERTLQYPVRSAMQQRMESGLNADGAFKTAQFYFLYNPDMQYSKVE